MATIIIGSIIQSRFIGSPITVPVTAASPAGTVTFHRVRLKVRVWDDNSANTGLPGEGHEVQFQFSTTVKKRETVMFDIASAFRAVVDKFQPLPTVFVYPSLSAIIEAVDDYMIDGIVYEGQSSSGEIMLSGKYMGALSDKERGYGISGSWSNPERYSRKPSTSLEICFYHPTAQGQSDGTSKHLLAGNTGLNAPSVASVTIPAGSASGVNVFGIPFPSKGIEIRFINSLGVHENVFVAGLPSKSVDITTEKYTISKPETITQFSRGLTIKKNDYEKWTYSTGSLDEAWSSWYIHEFLMARWMWICIDGAWVPCHVIPDETTTLLDEQNSKIIEVLFKIRLDINGSLI